MSSDVTENLDKRRNRVTDVSVQNAFLGGVNEARPAEDAIGQQDEPVYLLTATAPDGTEQTTTTSSVSEVLAMVESALANGKDINVEHATAGEPAAEDDIIDAEVVD